MFNLKFVNILGPSQLPFSLLSTVHVPACPMSDRRSNLRGGLRTPAKSAVMLLKQVAKLRIFSQTIILHENRNKRESEKTCWERKEYICVYVYTNMICDTHVSLFPVCTCKRRILEF